MASDSGLRALVAEEVSEQLDVTGLLDGERADGGIDGGEIGAAVGRRFGERVGFEVGASVGRAVHETIVADLDEGKSLRELRSDLTVAIRDSFGETVGKLDGVESMRGIDEREDEDGEATEAVAEADGLEADEADDETEANGEEVGDEPSAADLEGLRRETLEEFLSVVSYADLQSIAKDVDVRANLSREEMTERIVETVSESDDGLAAQTDGEASQTDGEES